MSHTICRFAVAVLLGAAASGCFSSGPDGPSTVRVAGVVYLDGKPLDGAEVRFIHQDFAGYATSGPDGKFELVQGAVPGENVVTVSKFEGNFELNPDDGYDLSQLEFERESAASASGEMANARRAMTGQVIPVEYSDPSKSKLKYTVPEAGTETADLRLTSK